MLKQLILLIVVLQLINAQKFPIRMKLYDERNSCSRWRLKFDQDSPNVFQLDGLYQQTEISFLSWYRFASKDTNIVRKTTAFRLASGNKEVLALYYENNVITACSYNENTNQVDCKQAKIDVRLNTWWLLYMAYVPASSEVVVLYGYQHEQLQRIEIDNVKHNPETSYTLQVGQSESTKNWPGYACVSRLKYGRKAHNEDEVKQEQKVVMPEVDPQPPQPPQPTLYSISVVPPANFIAENEQIRLKQH